MSNKIQNYIKQTIENNDIVLFMKGTSQAPLCGFSNVVCKILDSYNIKYLDINVLADENLRQGIKDYSDWPTIPQLYIKGEFIGGCDIAQDLYRSGDLKKMLGELKLI